MEEFARWAIDHGCWEHGALEGDEIQDKALALGLITKRKFDPEIDVCRHGATEAGDDWFVFSPALSPREATPARPEADDERVRREAGKLPNGLVDPDMPAQQMRWHFGEMTAQEMRTARAAIRFAAIRFANTRFRSAFDNARDELIEDAITFMEDLTAVPLLMSDDIEMRLEDVQAHARIEAESLRKRLADRALLRKGGAA